MIANDRARSFSRALAQCPRNYTLAKQIMQIVLQHILKTNTDIFPKLHRNPHAPGPDIDIPALVLHSISSQYACSPVTPRTMFSLCLYIRIYNRVFGTTTDR